MRADVALALAAAAVVCVACEREDRDFRGVPGGASAPHLPQDNRAGISLARNRSMPPYEKNAYAMAEGKHLYVQFNCVGCHSYGGGGMGPALMDDKWIYGGRPHDVFATIIDGRPNGMPSFRGRLTDNQVWQLVAYVRSLSGLGRFDAQPGRADAMSAPPPENARPAQLPQKKHALPTPPR